MGLLCSLFWGLVNHGWRLLRAFVRAAGFIERRPQSLYNRLRFGAWNGSNDLEKRWYHRCNQCFLLERATAKGGLDYQGSGRASNESKRIFSERILSRFDWKRFSERILSRFDWKRRILALPFPGLSVLENLAGLAHSTILAQFSTVQTIGGR